MLPSTSSQHKASFLTQLMWAYLQAANERQRSSVVTTPCHVLLLLLLCWDGRSLCSSLLTGRGAALELFCLCTKAAPFGLPVCNREHFYWELLLWVGPGVCCIFGLSVVSKNALGKSSFGALTFCFSLCHRISLKNCPRPGVVAAACNLSYLGDWGRQI